MRRHTLTLCILAALASCVPPHRRIPHGAPGWDQVWHGHASYPLGFRWADNDLEDAKEQATIGFLDVDLRPPGFPVSFVIQILSAYSDDTPDDTSSSPFGDADYTSVTQFNLGVRKVWYGERFQPFLGGGLAFVDVSVDEDYYYYYYDDHHHSHDGDSDSTLGGWLGAGVYLTSFHGGHLGLAVQYSTADVELEGEDYGAGGFEFMFLIGAGW